MKHDARRLAQGRLLIKIKLAELLYFQQAQHLVHACPAPAGHLVRQPLAAARTRRQGQAMRRDSADLIQGRF
jgi:hypothetical protein